MNNAHSAFRLLPSHRGYNMGSSSFKTTLILVAGLSIFVLFSLSRISKGNQVRATKSAVATAVQQMTIDASQRMREALAANIAARALDLSAADTDAAMLVAIEALNVLKPGDAVPHTVKHAFWQTLADGTVQVLTGGQSNQPATSPLLSPDEQWQAAFSANESVVRLQRLKVGQAGDSEASISLGQHAQAVTAVAFSPNSQWIATGSLDKTAVLYNLQQDDPANEPIRLTGHTQAITKLAFSPDARWLVTASDDHTLRLYPITQTDFADKEIVLEARAATEETPAQAGHGGGITAVAFSPDSGWLASAARDQTVRLWSLPDDPRQYAVVLAAPEGTVSALTFSPEGHWLTAVSGSQSFIWNLDANDLKSHACAAVGRNLTPAEWSLHLPELRYHETCDFTESQ